MKKIYFLFLMIVLSCQVKGQGSRLGDIPSESSGSAGSPKIDYSLSAGTSLFTGYVRGSSLYVAPELKWELSPKLKIEAGVLLMQNRLMYQHSSNLTGASVLQQSGVSYDGTLYLTGNYTFNPRLTMYGTVVKDFTNLNNTNSNPALRNSFQMMSMGVNYKLNDAITIGAGVKVVQSKGYLNPGCYNNYRTFNDLETDPVNPLYRF